VDKDEELIKKSKNLNLIVGGHDHLLFEEPRMVKNEWGHDIPILQAGANTMAVGSLYLDIHEGKTKVLSYEIIHIDQKITPEPKFQSFVETAVHAREKFFGRNWDEVIGFSEILLTGRNDGRMKNNRSCWSQHMARMTRQSTGADLGLHLDVLQSNQIEPGDVTFGNIVDNFTHFSSWDPRGWEITVVGIRGIFLKALLKHVSEGRNESSATFDGLYLEQKGQMGFFDTVKNIPSPYLRSFSKV
jgi:5'-nucleotidase / UDP-sugar diphosphatase